MLIKDKEKNIKLISEGNYSIVAKKCEFVWKNPEDVITVEENNLTKRKTGTGFRLRRINFNERRINWRCGFRKN